MAIFERDTSHLHNKQFDVVIIGGGISGAWIALHCAKLRLKTALIDQADFAARTSSASSKLLHGGIRYLQQMQFSKVRESAIERAHYLYAAPHLSNAIPFAIPTYTDIKRSKLFLAAGMLMYSSLRLGENRIIESADKRLPPATSISAAALDELFNLSDAKHTGAIIFSECHMYDSERMVLSIIQTAIEQGAQAYNYIEAKQYIHDENSVSGVVCEDRLTKNEFNLTAKLVINAAGPWIDNLNNSLLSEENPSPISGFATGSHIITRQLLSDHAIGITTKHKGATKIGRGGRHIFIIPWRGHSLIGTSYDELTNPNKPLHIDKEAINQLVENVNEALPSVKLTLDGIVSGYTGIYPIRTKNINFSVYQGSGEYQIIDHAESQGINGLITALGEKFTTGRLLAEKTVKLATQKLFNSSSTAGKIKLHNSGYQSLNQFIDQRLRRYQNLFPSEVIQHLICNYGSDIDHFIEFIRTDQQLRQAIIQNQPDLMGQVAWAVKKEMAITLNDVLFRRTSTGLLGISDQEVTEVAKLMAKYLSWDTNKTTQQIASSLQKIHTVIDTIKSCSE